MCAVDTDKYYATKAYALWIPAGLMRRQLGSRLKNDDDELTTPGGLPQEFLASC